MERNGFVGSSAVGGGGGGDASAHQRLLPHSSVNGSIVAVTSGSNVAANPMSKPPRAAAAAMGDYHALPQTDVAGLLPPPGYEMEMREMGGGSGKSNGNVVVSNGGSHSNASNSSSSASASRASFIESEHYPDLLDHHRSGPALAAAAVAPYHSHLVR